MEEIYLVLEYDNRLVYLPFQKLEYVDAFTSGYEDRVELCETLWQKVFAHIGRGS